MKERIAFGKRGRVGRADLLECYFRHKEQGVEHIAPLCGYQAVKQQLTEVVKKKRRVQSAGKKVDPTPTKTPTLHQFEEKVGGARYWRLVTNEYFPHPVHIGEEPEWYRRAVSFSDEETTAPDNVKPQPKPPLVPWPGLWPFLRSVLGDSKDGREVDWDRVVDHYAEKLTPLDRLPRISRKCWAPSCQIIVDFDERLALFWSDFHHLVRDLRKIRGRDGLDIRIFNRGPGKTCRSWKDPDRTVPYKLPRPGSPILVISDLGLYGIGKNKSESWLHFGSYLRQAGYHASVLTPTPPRLWQGELAKTYRLASWDWGCRLSRFDSCRASAIQPQGSHNKEGGVEELLALLSPAVSVEPNLLRAARLLLPSVRADVGSEAEAWHHVHTKTCLLGFSFLSEHIALYREGFRENFSEKVQNRLARLLRRYHYDLPKANSGEEQLILRNLLPEQNQGPDDSDDFMARTCKTLTHAKRSRPLQYQAMLDYIHGLTARQHGSMWAFSDELSVLWALANKDKWAEGVIKLPPGFDLSKVAWVLSSGNLAGTYSLRQQGKSFVLSRENEEEGQKKLHRAGSGLVRFEAGNSLLQIGWEDGRSRHGSGIDLAKVSLPMSTPLPPHNIVSLTTDQGKMVFEAMEKPSWAVKIGRDQYGLFTEFEVKGVRQRMRWIVPGRFMMGSPEDELERWAARETQHEVILSKGFWLADSACTQALWVAVMGTNPSRFKNGGWYPVERVSWEDCEEFVRKINFLVPGLKLHLPTEAQWEYGCRAGTPTPFFFGENIIPKQVNYNGKQPYAGGEKGEYRKETVVVRSLPANSWGLYEMHGNVWEWCADWFGDYPSGRVINPKGPLEGVDRVLRGGSWIDSGKDVRSVNRLRFEPSNRNGIFGFRLARGQ